MGIILKYYSMYVVVPLLLWASWSQIKGCAKANPISAKGIALGIITMIHAYILFYIFAEHYYIVQKF